jgi:CRP/FNR family transcriptional regulator
MDAQALRAARAAPMFALLDEAGVSALLDACHTRSFRPGETILLAGRKTDCFFVVLSGQVIVFQLSPRGDRQILHVCEAGSTFGEAAAWSGRAVPANAEAAADTRLLVVRRDLLQRAFARRPELAVGMLAGLAAKLHEFATLIERLSLKQVPARLAGLLLDLSAEAGGRRITLRQTKRQLAARLGTTPETLSRALGRLKRRGLIEADGRRIAILDAAGLRRLAGGE